MLICLFALPRDHRAVTGLENVRQLNIRRGKKLGFQLSHRQPRFVKGSRLRFLETQIANRFRAKDADLKTRN